MTDTHETAVMNNAALQEDSEDVTQQRQRRDSASGVLDLAERNEVVQSETVSQETYPKDLNPFTNVRI